ncbi:MAG: enoyl-CoA hydratase/isomerase family protein [Dehalococcoidia bacterium]|nr:enoyl-CoA hydratase/isomerase family protein [Dehalococcoidia bacterium]
MVALNAAGEPILLKEREGAIFIVRMNRPERMNAGMGDHLDNAWFEFRDDPTLKVMILTGVGDRAFSAGADLRANDARARELGAASAQELLDAAKTSHISPSITSNNLHLYKPIVAAINGWCLAGGCETAMGCDMRIIEAHAMMGLPEAKRGMGAKNTTHKMYYLTSLSAGLEVDWTSDPLTAERAVEIGFANEMVPKGKSLERALEIARYMCERPASYLQYHKERVFESLGTPLAYALAMEQRYPPQDSDEYREGLEASLSAFPQMALQR